MALSEFMFATGIENSYPTIEWNGKTRRIDEMEKCGHYKHWREDFELTKQLGIKYLRYGPPYYRAHLGDGARPSIPEDVHDLRLTRRQSLHGRISH